MALRPSGYPALVVPQEDIRATGTANPVRDASEQQQPGNTGAHRPVGTLVSGELLTFDDLEQRLPALDRLEGFDPAEPGLYRRVLIPAENSGGACVLAWAYVIDGPSETYLPGGCWLS